MKLESSGQPDSYRLISRTSPTAHRNIREGSTKCDIIHNRRIINEQLIDVAENILEITGDISKSKTCLFLLELVVHFYDRSFFFDGPRFHFYDPESETFFLISFNLNILRIFLKYLQIIFRSFRYSTLIFPFFYINK